MQYRTKTPIRGSNGDIPVDSLLDLSAAEAAPLIEADAIEIANKPLRINLVSLAKNREAA